MQDNYKPMYANMPPQLLEKCLAQADAFTNNTIRALIEANSGHMDVLMVDYVMRATRSTLTIGAACSVPPDVWMNSFMAVAVSEMSSFMLDHCNNRTTGGKLEAFDLMAKMLLDKLYHQRELIVFAPVEDVEPKLTH